MHPRSRVCRLTGSQSGRTRHAVPYSENNNGKVANGYSEILFLKQISAIFSKDIFYVVGLVLTECSVLFMHYCYVESVHKTNHLLGLKAP